MAARKIKANIPLYKKPLLTLEEAAELFCLGEKKLRQISNIGEPDFVLFVGSKKLFKREKLEAYLMQSFSI